MSISSGLILDNIGRKRLPIGIESFEMVVNNYVYVDKSLLVRELCDRPGTATLFCRPRRFGKSLALRMLQCYFEAGVEGARIAIPDRTHLFTGTAIEAEPELAAEHKGAHPVIFLSMGEVGGDTWEDARAMVADAMAGEFGRHDYVLSGDLSESDRELFGRIVARTASQAELAGSLAFLSDILMRHHGTGTVILIDEYDRPVTVGHMKGFRAQAIDFYRSWLTGALKATESLFLGVLTGVQRVSRESVFSGLNNIQVDTPLDHKFTEAFGFTEDEVAALAKYVGQEAAIDDLRAWYDGYRFGTDEVYNPWSVINYLADGGPGQPYWGNTSSNSIVHDLFTQAEGATAEELQKLAAGETVRESIDLATVYDMIGKDPHAIWSQLYLAGYLTTNNTEYPNDPDYDRELRVPNKEVRKLYRQEFANRSIAIAGNRYRLRDLHRALQEGDAPALEAALRTILLDSPSAFDLVRENSYHMLMLGLLYDVYGYQFPQSNRETGNGRADVVLVPERENEGKLPTLVLEIKWAQDASEVALAALAQEALAQIDAKHYTHPLPEGSLFKWGIVFSGKQCAVEVA